MPAPQSTQAHGLLSSPRFRNAKQELIQAIAEAGQQIRGVRPSPTSGEARDAYQAMIQEFNRDRGRDLYYPFVSSGLGSGPYIELVDGSVKLDMITGIGINFFGHTHPALLGEMIDALPSDTMQGNLQPGIEARDILRAVLKETGEGSRLKHAWLTCSGTMANEVALKIIRQKRAPATRILAFRDCFAGRSTAMQEITDNPKYREGQPVYGEVAYLPFFDARLGLAGSVENTLKALKENVERYPGKFAAIMMELVQGEGGFHYAPQDFYVRVFEEARKAGLAVWIDEVQTFGRTGEFFAYQTFGIAPLIDVVTIGKLLQACMVLYTEEYNPKPGLVAGTFSGSAVALRTGRRIVELLRQEGHVGKDGKIARMSARFAENIEKLANGSCKGLIGERRNLGGMIAVEPLGGSMDDVKAVLMRLFDQGLVAFYCGHGPYLIRLLPPMAAMNEADVDRVTQHLEKAILHVAGSRK